MINRRRRLIGIVCRGETTSSTGSCRWIRPFAHSEAGKMHHYRNLFYWLIPLAVPTASQLVVLRANLFRLEWMPLLFTALCFVYLLAWS
jgi:hypothetical protein